MIPLQRFHQNNCGGINKDSLFSLLNKLTVYQRTVLVLSHFDKMTTEDISYILEIGYWKVIYYRLISSIKLKVLLVVFGYFSSVDRFLGWFGQLTEVAC